MSDGIHVRIDLGTANRRSGTRSGVSLRVRIGGVRGVEVSRHFYDTEVAPCLDGVLHAAGRVGRGSDVLGFDDDVSQDHAWGERVTVITDRPTPPLPDGVELFTFASFVDATSGECPKTTSTGCC